VQLLVSDPQGVLFGELAHRLGGIERPAAQVGAQRPLNDLGVGRLSGGPHRATRLLKQASIDIDRLDRSGCHALRLPADTPRVPLLRSGASSALLCAQSRTEWPDERANARPAVAPKDHAFDATDNRSPLSYGRSLAVFAGVILPRCGKERLADDHQQHPRTLELPGRCPGVLLVYGEQRANAGIAGELALDGYRVHRASHAGTLRARCKPGEVDLVIFGRSPHRGLDVLRALRAGELAPGASGVRVLWMSTSRETTTSVLRAFEAGADDVTRTPLGYAELLARVRALLRRHSLIDGPALIVCGPLEIDTAARTVTFEGVPVELRPREFALLAHDPARVHEKQDLLHAVWGYRVAGSTRTVDSHASRLRRKLASAGADGWVCSTFGVGYRLAPDVRTATLRTVGA
jgi:DNA-binding response OmpR family regulator